MTPRRLTSLALLCFASSSMVFAQAAHPATTHHHPARPSADTGVTNPPGTPAVTGKVNSLYALRYVDTRIGTGELAAPGKIYSVHYTGWLLDGTKFDSSIDRGQPIEFPQGQRRVIIGWDTGFQGMHVGGKRRLYIPYQLAYGESGKGPIPAKAPLVFDVELVAQRDANAPAPTPKS